MTTRKALGAYVEDYELRVKPMNAQDDTFEGYGTYVLRVKMRNGSVISVKTVDWHKPAIYRTLISAGHLIIELDKVNKSLHTTLGD